MVAAPHSLVKSCHSLPCPEIQVCSPVAQCFDHLGTKFQLSRCSQGTLCRAPRERGENQVSTHTVGITAPPCLLPGLQSQLPGVPSALGLTALRGIIRVGSGRITDIPFNKPSSPSAPPQLPDHSLHLLCRWEQEPWCKSVALLVHAAPKSRKTPLHQTGTAPSIRSCYLCPSST